LLDKDGQRRRAVPAAPHRRRLSGRMGLDASGKPELGNLRIRFGVGPGCNSPARPPGFGLRPVSPVACSGRRSPDKLGQAVCESGNWKIGSAAAGTPVGVPVRGGERMVCSDQLAVRWLRSRMTSIFTPQDLEFSVPRSPSNRFPERSVACRLAVLPFQAAFPCARSAFPSPGSERLTGAVLDRLTHRCHILEASGESYRLKDARRRSLGRKTAESTAKPQETDQAEPSK